MGRRPKTPTTPPRRYVRPIVRWSRNLLVTHVRPPRGAPVRRYREEDKAKRTEEREARGREGKQEIWRREWKKGETETGREEKGKEKKEEDRGRQ